MTKFDRLCRRVFGPNPNKSREGRDLLAWAHGPIVYRVMPEGMNGVGAFLCAWGPTWRGYRFAERDLEPEEVAMLRRMRDPERAAWAERLLLSDFMLNGGRVTPEENTRWSRAVQRNEDARAIARLLAET